jgi:hypothetical protein
MPGLWKEWKAKSRLPTLSTSPLEISPKGGEIPTFPPLEQVSHFPSPASRLRPWFRLSKAESRPLGGFLRGLPGLRLCRRGRSRYRKGWRPAGSRRSCSRRAVVRHPSLPKCPGYRPAGPRHALRTDAGEPALPDRYQYLSAIDQRSFVAVEDPRLSRPAPRMDPCRPSAPGDNASVHYTFVHFQRSRRRSDRHDDTGHARAHWRYRPRGGAAAYRTSSSVWTMENGCQPSCARPYPAKLG